MPVFPARLVLFISASYACISSKIGVIHISILCLYLQLLKHFFNFYSVGYNLFYLCIVVYLYGDLAIYAAAVPKSLRDVSW